MDIKSEHHAADAATSNREGEKKGAGLVVRQ
jgi:hypothetical protein